MKKLFALVLIAMMLLTATCFADVTQLPAGTSMSFTFSEYGATADVSLDTVTDESGYRETVALTVANEYGAKAVWQPDSFFRAEGYLVMNDDCTLIIVSGDVMSDDYFTYVFSYEDDLLVPVKMPDMSRGERVEGAYNNYGYGMVTAIDNTTLTLCGSQDVLGTYFGSREVELVNGRFEFADDGLWHFSRDLSDPEFWANEYGHLTTAVDLEAADLDGNAITLTAGTNLVITASDLETVAYFTTEDGTDGCLAIADNTESWGRLVNGIPESDAFEFLPYAD